MVVGDGRTAPFIRGKQEFVTFIGSMHPLDATYNTQKRYWLFNQHAALFFQVMTLNPVCESVETAQGVPLTVTGVAQVKIMKNADLLQTASEQFLGKKEHEIKSTVLQTLEGHLRAILGTQFLMRIITYTTCIILNILATAN